MPSELFLGKNSEEPLQILREGVSHCQAHGFSSEAMHLPGDGPHVLLEHAEEWDADFIVLGNTARHVLMEEVFGNVTRYLIEHSRKALFLSQ